MCSNHSSEELENEGFKQNTQGSCMHNQSPSISSPLLRENCRKCQTAKSHIILRKTDQYCSECFMKYAVHKFRSTIGKAQSVKPNDKILLAYSGGLCSGSMIAMVGLGQEECGSQKIKQHTVKPSILHIDEGGILNLSIEERRSHIEFVMKQVRHYNFELYICSLEFCLAKDFNDVDIHQYENYQIPLVAPNCQLRQLLDSTDSLSTKEDLLMRLKHRLITLSAAKLGFKKVFVGNSATQLAGKLLSAVAKGRGSQIADDIGFIDRRSGIEFLRPMREFVNREVGYVAHFLGIHSTSIPPFSFKHETNSSIDRLTEDFVVKLQVNFPGTVTTLYRIGDKMQSMFTSVDRDVVSERMALCVLCFSKIEVMTDCSANSARMISENVSSSARNGNLIGIHNALSMNGSYSQQASSSDLFDLPLSTPLTMSSELTSTTSMLPKSKDLEAALCYGCRQTVQLTKRMDLLPRSITDEIRCQLQRQDMI